MNTNSVQKLLRFLDLSKDESLIYTTLCAEEALTLAGIAKKTGIHRPRLYALLPTLVKREFLTERLIGKRTYYRPIEPRQLYSLISERSNELLVHIDELQNTFENSQKKPDVEFNVGDSGGKKMFDDIADVVPKEGTIYRYSARALDNKDFKPSKSYAQRRNKGHLNRVVITSESRAARKTKRLDRLVKIIPESFDLFDDNVSQMIYEDRTVIVDHDNNSYFTIKSEKIAQFQRKLFKLLWKYLDEPKVMKK